MNIPINQKLAILLLRNKIKTLNIFFENLILSFVYYTGIFYLFRFINRKKIVILMYHGVLADDEPSANKNRLQVKKSTFRRQMEYLSKRYNVCSLSDALNDRIITKKHNVIITFDDGYENNYLNAYPILLEFGIPACIFLSTSILDTENLFWWDRVLLSSKDSVNEIERMVLMAKFKELHPSLITAAVNTYINEKLKTPLLESETRPYRALRSNQIKEMASSGLIEFGCHMHRHEILDNLKTTEAEESIRTSLKYLEPLVGNVNYFCYPNGSYNQSHIDLLKKMGFTAAMTSNTNLWSSDYNLYELPRIGVWRHYALSQFAAILSGFWTMPRELIRKIIPVSHRNNHSDR